MFDRIATLVTRYKLFHVAFWCWIAATLVHNEFNRHHHPWLTRFFDVVAITATQMLCAYFVLLVLVPHFLYKRRYGWFVLAIFGSVVTTALLNVALRDLQTWLIVGKHLSNAPVLVVTQIVDTLVTTLVFITVTTLLHSYQTHRRNETLERERLTLDKERLQTELNFLRAQVNPHFLFNALNNINVLIKVDAKTASHALVKFSGLLRYNLYECLQPSVPLKRELEFLNDYMALETMRNGENLRVTYQAKEANADFDIAPFLLIHFVENAFKHVSRYTQGMNFVNVEAAIKDKLLYFTVSNSFDGAPSTNSPGIGLGNVARRLELLYPNRHKLNISKKNGVFNVNLQLLPYDDQLPGSG